VSPPGDLGSYAPPGGLSTGRVIRVEAKSAYASGLPVPRMGPKSSQTELP
jgi:hypothetical protein